MKVNINPFNSENPMTLKDAVVVALLSAFVTAILSVIARASIGEVREDPEAFLFAFLQAFAVSWAGNFMTLAGLEQYMKRGEGTPGS